jgi:hypothetical protein
MQAVAETFAIGDLQVRRLGFGAMRLTGPGVWGEPHDRSAATRVLRRAVDLGVNLIDTADAYGPGVNEQLIAEALHPYPDDLVIATKGGRTRQGPYRWGTDCRPASLRQACETSLKRLRLERIDLYQLHGVDSQVPLEESVGALAEGRRQGTACRRLQRQSLAAFACPVVRVDRFCKRTARASPIALRRLWSTSASEKGWRFCPGSRSFAASSPADAAASAASPPRTEHRRGRWLSPGCCNVLP